MTPKQLKDLLYTTPIIMITDKGVVIAQWWTNDAEMTMTFDNGRQIEFLLTDRLNRWAGKIDV